MIEINLTHVSGLAQEKTTVYIFIDSKVMQTNQSCVSPANHFI